MVSLMRKLVLLLSFVLLLSMPALGAWVRWGGWPPGFGIFPPAQSPIPTPGFNPLYFAAGCVVAGAMSLFLLFPALFGFTKAPPRAHPPRLAGFPWWFYLGSAVCLAAWGVLWFGHLPLAAYMFTPMWWGFIVALDGLVYKRTGGKSLLATRPRSMLVLSAMSTLGWFMFEWLNYFILENWYYPNTNIFSYWGNVVCFALAFGTVWPAVFEFYCLLDTFPGLRERWMTGPRVTDLRPFGLLGVVAGLALGALSGIFPHLMFFAVWISPLFLLGGVLILLGYWTPFSPLRKGDWSPLVLGALASLGNGFFWEFWNHGSEFFHAGQPVNPNFWIYDIPYVNVIHLFSEMPLLGYFGYLPFGLIVWVWWLVAAHLCNLRPDFDLLSPPAALGGVPESADPPDTAS